MNESPILVGITIRADGSAQVTGELNRVQESITGGGSAAQNSNRQFADMARSTQSLTSIMGAFGITLGAVGLVAFGKDLLRTIEQVQNMEVRLKGLTKNAQDYAQVQSYLSEVSARHHKNNLVLADSFSRLLTLEQAGLITRKQSTQLLEGMSNAASKTGASTEQLKQSMFGFSQALGSGTVHMEELNQVTEPMPGLLNKIASASGYTVGEFRNLVAEGRITSEVFGKIMVSALEGYQGAAESAGDTLTAKYADISNAWTELAAVVESPVSDVITPVLEGIASVVAGLTQDFRELGAVWDSIMGKKITGGAPDNGMQIDLTGRAKPPESDAAIQQAAIRKEIEQTAGVKTKAAATHAAASRHIASGLSEEQRAAKAAADEAKRNYDQAIKSSEDYIKRLQDEAAQIGMTATQRADFAAEQIAQAMNEAQVRSGLQVQFLTQAHELAVALEKVKEAEKVDEAVKTEMDALIDRYQQLTLSAEEYYAAKLKTQGMSAEQAAPLIKQNAINNDLEKQAEAADAARQALESYSSSIDSASSSMQNLGDVTGAIFDSSLGGVNQLVGAFESMLRGIDQSKKAYADLAVVKKNIDNFDPSLYKDQEAAIKLKAEKQTQYEKDYQNLQTQTFNQYMDGTRQMAGALTSMFEDNKTAQIANQAVALVTLGIQAVQAIVTQGQGDPYTAFARIAAMAAIVASLVSSVGGKSPNASSAGVMAQSKTTGTVLGDKTATSNSIGNVYELLKDIHAEEYAELRGINEGVASLHDSMTSVVTRLFQANAEGIVAPSGILQPGRKLGLGSASYKMSASTDLITGMPGVGIVLKLVTDLLQKYDPVQKLLNKIFFGTVKEKVVGGGYAIDPFQIGGQLSASQYNTIERTRKSWISKSTSYREVSSPMNEKVQIAIEDMFNAMGDTMLATADTLGKSIGMDLSGRVLGYIIPSLRIELYGLSGEEAAKKLNGVMSTVMDDMANAVFGDIVAQYQQLGEGMLETAIRIVSEIAVVTNALEVSGLKLKPQNIIEFSDAIVQAMGGLNEFKKSWQAFFDAFYSDAEKQARLKDQLFSTMAGDTGQLTDVFTLKAPKLTKAQKKAGETVQSLYPDFDPYATLKTLEASREGYRKVLESININTQAGAKQYSTLIKLAGAADQYYQGLEAQAARVQELENNRHELELQLMESSGNAAEALAIRRKDELAAMDQSLRTLQESIYVAEDSLIAQKKASDLAKQQRTLDIQLMEAIGNATGALAAKRSDELAAMDESLRATQSAIWAENDLAATRKLAADIAKQQRSLDIQLMEATGNTAGALAAKRADELAALDDSLKSTQLAIWAALDLSDAQAKAAAAAQDAINAAKAANDAAVQAAKDAISSAMGILTKSVQTERDRITGIYNKSIESTKSAIDKLTDSIGKLKSLSQSLKSTLEKFSFPGSESANRASAQATISAALIIARKGGSISDIDGLIKALDVVSQPSEALFSNFTDYQRDFYKTAIDISNLSLATDKQLSSQDKNLIALNAQLAATEAGYKAQNERLDSILESAQAQIDAVNGTTIAVMSVEAAIKNLALMLPSQSTRAIAGYAAGGAHSGGWRIVGENGPELENTPPSRIFSNSQSKSLLDNRELIAEIRQLRADIRVGQAVIAANTKDTSKQLKQWDVDGLPATTTA